MPLIVSRGALCAAAFGFGSVAKSVVWGTPTSLGVNASTTGATVTLTGCTVPAGALIVVCVMDNAAVAGSVADTLNSYALASSVVVNAANILQAFYAYNVTALSSGTITYTKHTSGATAVISAFYITGELTGSTPLDLVTLPTSGTSTSPSITSGTPTVSNEFFVGFIGTPTAGVTLTQDVTHAWQNFPVIENANNTIAGGSFVNAGSGALTYAPTLSGSVKWGALLISFKHS